MIEYHSKISIALLIITILTHVVSLTNTIRLIPKKKKKNCGVISDNGSKIASLN